MNKQMHTHSQTHSLPLVLVRQKLHKISLGAQRNTVRISELENEMKMCHMRMLEGSYELRGEQWTEVCYLI